MTADPSGNGYNLKMDGQAAADYGMAEKIRSELVAGLGLSGPSGGAKEYGDLITRESLRTAQPTLENALIGRGLGGSSIYREALTDLISKASTQGTLSAADYTRNNLASLNSNYFSPIYGLGQNLLQLATSKSVSDQQLAQQLYQMLLPYTATINQPGDSGWGGAMSGAGHGAMMGAPLGPLGMLAGGVIGGGVGYFGSKQDPSSQSLMMYNMDQQNKGNSALLSLLSGAGKSSGGNMSSVFGGMK